MIVSCSYPSLRIPESRKELFRIIEENEWSLAGTLSPKPEWSEGEVLVYTNSDAFIYLGFYEEPEWCGNSKQQSGITEAIFYQEENGFFPENILLRVEMTGDWEKRLRENMSLITTY